MTIHTYIPIYSTPFTQPTYYNHLLCIWVSRKAMALAVLMLLLEQVCTSGGKHYWKGHQKRPDKQVSSIFPRRACACRPAFVRESWQLHKHLKTIYSLLIQLFFVYKKIVFWCWTSFVFCHQKKRDKHSNSWALLLIWRKVIRYIQNIYIIYWLQNL